MGRDPGHPGRKGSAPALQKADPTLALLGQRGPGRRVLKATRWRGRFWDGWGAVVVVIRAHHSPWQSGMGVAVALVPKGDNHRPGQV